METWKLCRPGEIRVNADLKKVATAGNTSTRDLFLVIFIMQSSPLRPLALHSLCLSSCGFLSPIPGLYFQNASPFRSTSSRPSSTSSSSSDADVKRRSSSDRPSCRPRPARRASTGQTPSTSTTTTKHRGASPRDPALCWGTTTS